MDLRLRDVGPPCGRSNPCIIIQAQTNAWTRSPAFQDPRFQPLRTYYTICVKDHHSDCFYDGHCEPAEEVAAP